jgi:hypothetical protein
MTAFSRFAKALSVPLDILLADIAIRIQLTPSSHDLAVGRAKTIQDYIERKNSPLEGKVELFYPQGSMAIGATIAKKLKNDEFDIDLIAQLLLPADIQPARALDILLEAISADEGSRYYNTVERRTRCITVHYADQMHLDVTPTILVPDKLPRTSTIFHSPTSVTEPLTV